MATKLNGTDIEYTDGSKQFTKSPLVKTRYTSHPTVNLSLPTWGGETDVSPNIDMGVPQKSNNWYRCEYYNITDDWPGSGNGGMGLALYRYTPSSGWLRAQAQGQHANYDNDSGDFYATPVGLWYIPVHPSYPTETHIFKLMGTKHPSCNIRVNSGIGADNRIGGWINNQFSVTEVDCDNVAAINNLTTY